MVDKQLKKQTKIWEETKYQKQQRIKIGHFVNKQFAAGTHLFDSHNDIDCKWNIEIFIKSSFCQSG